LGSFSLRALRISQKREYYKHKDEVKSVEFLRRNANSIMDEDVPERKGKMHELGL